MNLVYGVRFAVYGKKNQSELFGMKQKKSGKQSLHFRDLYSPSTLYRKP
jgi:hypothetical protein